jgi:hypothetical protein
MPDIQTKVYQSVRHKRNSQTRNLPKKFISHLGSNTPKKKCCTKIQPGKYYPFFPPVFKRIF